MATTVYAKYETLRLLRNRRFLLFSLAFPIVFYFLIAGPNKNDHNFGGTKAHPTHLFAPQYYMVGLLAWGVMSAALAGGARIAAERSVGWNRQLRLTPLTSRQYLTTKVATGYLMCALAMVLLYLSGTFLGVRLDASQWLVMSGLVLVAIIPFAGLGIGLGHVLTVDSMGPALGIGTGLLAFLGGTWFPITGGGTFQHIAEALPSYWLVQAGHVGLGGTKNPWGMEGWLVIAVWSVACIVFAVWAFRRDTKRVG